MSIRRSRTPTKQNPNKVVLGAGVPSPENSFKPLTTVDNEDGLTVTLSDDAEDDDLDTETINDTTSANVVAFVIERLVLFLFASGGVVAALLTSSSFAMCVRWFSPGSGDGFGLKVVCAALRMLVLLMALIRAKPRGGKRLKGSMLRFLTALFVEAALLLPQPLYTTVVGGTFKGGDAFKAASSRLGRQVWLSSEHGGLLGALVLAFGSWLIFSDKIKPTAQRVLASVQRLLDKTICAPFLNKLRTSTTDLLTTVHTTAAPIVSITTPIVDTVSAALSTVGVMKLLAAVVSSAVWHYGYAHSVSYLSNGIVSPSTLSALPPFLLQNRHEVSLFEWSVPSHICKALIIFGDLLMANPTLTPTLGVIGSASLGLGLLFAGISPSPGFTLNATVWGLAYACKSSLDSESEVPGTDFDGELRGATLNVETKLSSMGKGAGSSSLKIFGRPFDYITHYVFLFTVLLVLPVRRPVSAAILLTSVYYQKPPRASIYDQFFLTFLATLVLGHLVSSNGIFQTTRACSAVTIALVGGKWSKEVLLKEKGKIWSWIKRGTKEVIAKIRG